MESARESSHKFAVMIWVYSYFSSTEKSSYALFLRSIIQIFDILVWTLFKVKVQPFKQFMGKTQFSEIFISIFVLLCMVYLPGQPILKYRNICFWQ